MIYSALILLSIVTSVARATPAQVVIIRHGEKPEMQSAHLNQQGCIRAYALVNFLSTNPSVIRFGKPVALFAMKPKMKIDSSLRPIETLIPAAQDLHLKIFDPAERTAYKTLSDAILKNSTFSGKMVVVAWEHKAIPFLAQSLGLKLNGKTDRWNGQVFDQAWVLQLGKKDVSLEIVPERVLPTDNAQGGEDHWSDGPKGSLSAEFLDRYPQCKADNALGPKVRELTVPPAVSL